MPDSAYRYTVILSTFNEAHRIEYALRNFHRRAHILVVDNFSTDETVDIARRYTDLVYQRKNPGWISPECHQFRFKMAPTDYVVSTYAGRIHPPELLDLYDQVAAEKRFRAIALYNMVYSYGKVVTSYGRPFSSRSGAFAFFDKRYVDTPRGVIHCELPFIGTPADVFWPSRRRAFCVISYRDDNSEMTELKHTRYANEDARQRFVVGDRTQLFKFIWVFNRHLWGCLLWRGAIWQGMPGIINSLWRAIYYLSIEIRIWEMQEGLTKENIITRHNELRNSSIAKQ